METDGLLYRQKRALSSTGATSTKGITVKCNDWSEWINHSRPTNRMESEIPTDNDLDLLCPRRLNGRITDMRCKDDKGEPFSPSNSFSLNGDKSLNFSCGVLPDGRRGVVCVPIAVNTTCPDYAVNFYCECTSMYLLVNRF